MQKNSFEVKGCEKRCRIFTKDAKDLQKIQKFLPKMQKFYKR